MSRQITLSYDSDLTMLWNVIGRAADQFETDAIQFLTVNPRLHKAFKNQAEQARRIYNELEEQL